MEFATFSQVNSPAFQVQEADVQVFSHSYLLMGVWIEIAGVHTRMTSAQSTLLSLKLQLLRIAR